MCSGRLVLSNHAPSAQLGHSNPPPPYPPFSHALPHPSLHSSSPSAGPSNQIVLHENKKYYASAEATYGEDVEALVQEEDTQLLSEPIVAPIKVRKYNVEEKDMPVTRYDKGSVFTLSLP